MVLFSLSFPSGAFEVRSEAGPVVHNTFRDNHIRHWKPDELLGINRHHSSGFTSDTTAPLYPEPLIRQVGDFIDDRACNHALEEVMNSKDWEFVDDQRSGTILIRHALSRAERKINFFQLEQACNRWLAEKGIDLDDPCSFMSSVTWHLPRIPT
jgi:hypothetical protein